MSNNSPVNSNAKPDEQLWVTPEKSLFRTRIPRPIHAYVHLFLAFAMFLVALGIAVFYSQHS